MTETEVKAEECSDIENQFSSGKENNNYSSDGYFEENTITERRNGNCREIGSFTSAETDESVSVRYEGNKSNNDKNFESINTHLQVKKIGSKNNIKCGEIYWSKSLRNYLYKCSMCPTRKFMGCIALKHHHSRYHKLFDETQKKQNNMLSNNDEVKKAVLIKPNNTDSSENEKQIALEQLQSLFKRKILANQCFKCRKKFQSQQELIQHSETHINKDDLCCIYCKEAFSKLEELKIHQVTHTDKEHFPCSKKQHEPQYNEAENSSKAHKKNKIIKAKVKILK